MNGSQSSVGGISWWFSHANSYLICNLLWKIPNAHALMTQRQHLKVKVTLSCWRFIPSKLCGSSAAHSYNWRRTWTKLPPHLWEKVPSDRFTAGGNSSEFSRRIFLPLSFSHAHFLYCIVFFFFFLQCSREAKARQIANMESHSPPVATVIRHKVFPVEERQEEVRVFNRFLTAGAKRVHQTHWHSDKNKVRHDY